MDKKMKIVGIVLMALSAVAAVLIVIASRSKPLPPGGATVSEGLSRPRGIALDKAGNQYVVDSLNGRIEIRNPGGNLLKRIGTKGSPGSIKEGQFREPCGLAVDKDGNVYVADTFYTEDPKGGLPWGRIQKFSPLPECTFLSAFGKGEQQGNLFGPRDVACDSSGNLYVSDTGNCRILKFSPAGNFLSLWGSRGDKEGQFIEPFGLAFDKNDLCYVADRLNYRIQVFKSDGTFQRMWKVAAWEEAQVNVEPYMAVDSAKGFIYVTDPTKNKVHRWDLQGGKHKEYTQASDGTAFSLPTGIAFNPADGTLLVTQSGLNRVMTLKP